MSNEMKKFYLYLLISQVAVYFGFCFVQWSFPLDFSSWDSLSRYFYLTVSFFGVCAAAALSQT